ncbi:DUF58 domain-containing protein [Lentisphaerota bacterium WC36G]|nr:DUF58 domain-containing protein [Lentisphaerae bacterium WC36]
MNLSKNSRKLIKKFQAGPDWIVPIGLFKIQKHFSFFSLLINWVGASYLRWFSESGRILVLTFFVFCISATITDKTRLIFAIGFIPTVFIIDFITGFIFRPKLELHRQVPHRARCDSVVTIRYTLKNNRKHFNCYNLIVDNCQSSKALPYVAPKQKFEVIKSQQKLVCEQEIALTQRGKFILPSVVSASFFPFGLFTWNSKNDIQRNITVYPSFNPFESLILPSGSRFQRHGNSIAKDVGETNDFAGCREYRHGDDVRKINWKSYGKDHKLTIKEYHQDYLIKTAVILDINNYSKNPFDSMLSYRIKHGEETTEAAIKITAAIAEFICHNDNIIDIFAAGDKTFHLQAVGRDKACLNIILDELACLQNDRHENKKSPFTTLSSDIIDEINSIGSVFMITKGWTKKHQEFYEKMIYANTYVKRILICDENDFSVPSNISISHKSINNGEVFNI